MKTKQLKKIFTELNRVIGKKNSIVVLDYFLYNNGAITVADPDLETYLTIKNVDCGPGVFAIYFQDVFNMLKKIKTDPDIAFSSKGAILLDGKEKFKFKYRDTDDWPIIPEVNNSIGILRTEDIKSIKTASKYISEDSFRPVVSNVLVTDHIVATDMSVLIYLKTESHLSDEVLLSGKVSKLLEETNYEAYKTDAFIRLESENHVFVSKFPPGTFPSWKNAIPNDPPIQASVSKKELMQQIDLSMIAANSSELIIFYFTNDEIEISAQDIDMERSYHDCMKCTCNDEITIGFKGSLMLRVLNDLKDETVEIRMTDPTRGAIFNDNYLLMSMMVNAY